MSTCFIGEVRLFSFSKTPDGWLPCDGRELAISDSNYQALYSLISVIYGGNGVTTFKLPNLNGRVVIGKGKFSTGATTYALGATGGAETVSLTQATVPPHTHLLTATTKVATDKTPSPSLLQAATPAGVTRYVAVPASPVWHALSTESFSTDGGGASHNNIMPGLGLKYCIAYQGEYPQQP